MIPNMNLKHIYILIAVSGFSLNTVSTQASEEDEMAAMQRKLNAEVMEKPFSVEDEKKIESYIKSAMQKDLKPPKKAPDFWRQGYTCADIYHYGWNHYRRCRYYRHYYGRYWF